MRSENYQSSVYRSTATDDFDAGDLPTGGLGRGRRRDSGQQVVVLTIHQEDEIGEKVGLNEGLWDVDNHEPLREIPA
jgi:hypothetical protein